MTPGAVSDSSRRLKVLAVTRDSPDGPSLRLRILLLREPLRRRGIDVDLLHLPSGSLAKRRALRNARLTGYDICWLHRYTAWPWDIAPVRRTASQMVFDYDDPVCFHPRRPDNWSWTHWLKFRSTIRLSSAVLAGSDNLVTLAQPFCRRVILSPLCADPDAYRMSACPRRPGELLRLIWVGSRVTFGYLEQVRDHLDTVGRTCPGAELHLVGHFDLPLTTLPVVLHPWSHQAEVDQLAQAHVGLSPLPDDRWAWGKATLKPLQYMANGLPFIGTAIGVNIRLAEGGRHGVLVATPQEWAAAVRGLMNDESRRQAMGGAAVAYIRRYHAPDVLADITADLFRSLVPSGKNNSTLTR